LHYTFILNPKASNGQTGRKRTLLNRLAQENELNFEILETEYSGHAAELATQVSQHSDVIVAVGGDGTVHEVVQGIIASGKDVVLGVIPWGTGNDFAKMLHLPHSPKQAIQVLKQAQIHACDYGVATFEERQEGKTTIRSEVFINQLGVGFDAQAAIEAFSYKYLPGRTLPYLAAVLVTLKSWKCPKVDISLAEKTSVFEGEFWFMTVGNGQCSGGSFYLTPAAQIEDGLFDICVIRSSSKARLLQMLPMAFKGKHVEAKETQVFRTAEVHLKAHQALPVHADGEVLSKQAYALQVTVQPNGIRVIMAS
jgi:YegS/Rv2252/BmrU family lipid kinase